MSSINNIKKVNYSDNRDSVVALKEYILLKDEAAQKQLCLFKFQNNLNQQLTKMTFNIMQFDADNFMIKKSIVNYENFTADRGEAFVPKMKMELDLFTETIQIELTYAKFERVEFTNGILKPIPYTMKEFRDNKEKPVKKTKKEEKLLEKQRLAEIKKNNKKTEKRTISVEDVTSRNKPRISAVLTTLLSLVLIAFVVTSVIIFGLNSPLFSKGDYTYKKISNNTVAVYKYYGNEYDINIPEEIDGNKIVGIDKKAFKNAKISSITFNGSIDIGISAFENCSDLSKINGIQFINTIGDYGFKNCTSLTTFKSNELDSIGVGSFEGCTKLSSVIIPNAMVENNAFKNDASLKELDIRDTNTNSLYGIFSFDGIALKKLKISKKNIGKDYFKNIKSLTELEFGVEPNIEFGALRDTNIANHYINETVETLNGKIIAIEPDANGMITLPSTITDKDHAISFLSIRSNLIKVLQTEMQISLDNDDLLQLDNLIGFGIVNDGKVNYNALDGIDIESIYWDSSKNIIDTVHLPITVKSVYIGNHNDNAIKLFNQLNGLYSYEITDLIIDNVKSVSIGALDQLDNLTYLEISNYGSISFEDIGVSKTVEVVVINGIEKLKELSCYISDYDNLTDLYLPTNIETLNATIYSCDNLIDITIPKSVKTIGNNFISESGIDNVIFEENSNLKTIGNSFIDSCNNIEVIELPRGLKSIGNYAFSNCPNLWEIVIPETVETIGSYLVNDGIMLDDLVIPSSVTSLAMPLIGNDCNIYSITTPFVGSNKDSKVAYNIFNRSSLTTYYLRVRGNLTVDSSFFTGLTNLETLIVDGKTIGAKSNVFYRLENLKNLKFDGELPCTLRDLFGRNMYLSAVVIDTTSEIGEDFFYGMNIYALAVNSYKKMYVYTFDSTTISNLFIGSSDDMSLFKKTSFYITTLDNVYNNLFLGFDVPKEAKDFDNVSKLTYREFIINFTNMKEIVNGN